MNATRMNCSIALATCLTVTLAATPTLGQDGAKWAPMEAAVFVQIDDMAQWQQQWIQDPLAEFLRDKGIERGKHHHGAWVRMAEGMDMAPEALFDAFFGQRIVLLGDDNEDTAFVLLTTMAADISAKAIDALDLKADGRIGDHRRYLTPDGRTQVVVDGDRVAMARKDDEAWLREVVLLGADDEEAPTLADDETFKQWMHRLPAGDRAAVAFAREGDGDGQEIHALACLRIGRGLDVHYAGTSDKLDEMVAHMGEGGALEFGPLPASTIGATTINLFDPAPKGAERLDGLVQPHSFKDDVLDGLEAPTVFFLGQVEGESVEPKTAFDVPVAGMAVKLGDDDVSEHIDTMLGRAMGMMRMGMRAQGLPPFEMSEHSHEGVDYHVADFGDAIVKKTGREDMRGALRLAMGHIGDWYVIASHDDYFRQAIAANERPALALSGQAALLPVEQKLRPLFATFFRAPMMAQHLETWLSYWEQERPTAFEAAQDRKPADREARIIRCVRILAGSMDYYDTVGMQAWAGEGDEADIVYARVQIRRR